MDKASERTLLGVIFLAVGLFIGLIASGEIAIAEEDLHAPRWILGLIAVAFAGFGLAVLVPLGSRFAPWFGGAIVVSMTLIFGWVALFGAGAQFSGDWPFFSRSANVLIARIVFGCVTLLGLAMIVGAAMKTRKK